MLANIALSRKLIAAVKFLAADSNSYFAIIAVLDKKQHRRDCYYFLFSFLLIMLFIRA